MTSKHHDGYCLFPSTEASESYGMAWNSVESGPKRDLVGDLTSAVKNAGLKIVNEFKRPVLNRVEKDRNNPYSESIFHMKRV